MNLMNRIDKAKDRFQKLKVKHKKDKRLISNVAAFVQEMRLAALKNQERRAISRLNNGFGVE